MYEQCKHQEELEKLILEQTERKMQAREKIQKEAPEKTEKASSSIDSEERAFSAEEMKKTKL